MAASILLRVISAIDDRRLVLSNARAARLMSIGNTWNHIRVGMRLSANASAAIASGDFMFGVCNGVSSVYGDQTPTHVVGVRSSPTPVPNFGYSAGPPAILQQINPVAVTVVSGVETVGSAIGLTDMKISAAVTSVRSVFMVELTKGSPNYTITAGYLQGTSADISLPDFLTAMETTMANLTGGWNANYKHGSDVTMAVNEANGILNGVCFSWGNASATLEVSDVAYARYS